MRPAALVHQTSTSTGTGNFALVAENGKQAFSAAFGTGASNLCMYFIAHRTAAEWEYGEGYMSAANTLVRQTPLKGSAGAATLVNFSAGTKDVSNDYSPDGIPNAELLSLPMRRLALGMPVSQKGVG